MATEQGKFDKIAYNNAYNAQAYDRINLTLPKGSKDELKEHAEGQGESINAFIKRAIMEVTEMDNMHRAYQRGLLHHLERAKEALDSNNLTEAKRILSTLIEDTNEDIK